MARTDVCHRRRQSSDLWRGRTRGGGFTALHAAVDQGHENVVAALLNADADPNVETAARLTPLRIANNKGFNSIAELLLARNATVSS